MRLLRIPEPLDHADWLYEVKFDGFRALAHRRSVPARLAQPSRLTLSTAHGFELRQRIAIARHRLVIACASDRLRSRQLRAIPSVRIRQSHLTFPKDLRPIRDELSGSRQFGTRSCYLIGPSDPFAIGSALAILIGVALAASYLPARRASQLDPTQALRYE